MRKLVTVREVSKISPIEGADRIEIAHVDGWQCVVKKGEFVVGSMGMFFEIDSMLPITVPRFSFFQNGIREVDGVKYARIKTIKLRGQISQGLLMPVNEFISEILDVSDEMNIPREAPLFVEGAIDSTVDFAAKLGVIKYERPDSGNGGHTNSGKTAGDFPHFIRKSDQPRIQNAYRFLSKQDQSLKLTPTLKLDGSSTTVAYLTDTKYHMEKLPVDDHGGQAYVCSRNLTLLEDAYDAFWIGARNSGLVDAAKEYHLQTGRNYAYQGELVGGSIQRNHENHDEYKVYAYAVFDIDTQQYLTYSEMNEIFESDAFAGVPRVPVFDDVTLGDFETVQEFLAYADAVLSPFTKLPEGVVFHQTDVVDGSEPITFKAISNRYLIKSDG